MRRPSYQRAIQWLADNDDCDWLADERPIMSVCAGLVADMFGKEDAQVQDDLRKAIRLANPRDRRGYRNGVVVDGVLADGSGV